MENKRNQKVMEHNLRVPSYEQNKKKEFPEETFGLSSEKSTRELAMEWINSFPNEDKQMLATRYYSRSFKSLTGREIEEIWRKETQSQYTKEELDGINDFKKVIKSNQKQYSQEEVDMLLDQQAARTTAQVLKNNTKQFKEFNPELFKSYIDKFSDEDKVRAMVVLLENQKEEYKFNCFLAALKQMNLDSNTHSNIMTLVALKDI
jgi:hypothetical protein